MLMRPMITQLGPCLCDETPKWAICTIRLPHAQAAQLTAKFEPLKTLSEAIEFFTLKNAKTMSSMIYREAGMITRWRKSHRVTEAVSTLKKSNWFPVTCPTRPFRHKGNHVPTSPTDWPERQPYVCVRYFKLVTMAT